MDRVVSKLDLKKKEKKTIIYMPNYQSCILNKTDRFGNYIVIISDFVSYKTKL